MEAKSKLPQASSDVTASCYYGPFPRCFSISRIWKPKESSPAWSRFYRRFKLQDLLKATNNFNLTWKFSEDACFSLYEGQMKDYAKYPVTIKQFESGSGYSNLSNEMEVLSRFYHPNIVSPSGYCLDASHNYIVYNHIAQGNLLDHLLRENGESPLSWKKRLQICIGAARGLEYLHSSNPIIIHRDIKSRNILLDKNWGAKILDFSLAKSIPSSQLESDDDYISTDVGGTLGYIDPEYLKSGKLTTKSDVYSFGVVLFEVLRGRKPMDFNLPREQISLTEWSRQHIEDGKLEEIIDPPLKGEIAPDCLNAYAKLAYLLQ